MPACDQYSTAGVAPAARLRYWNDLALSVLGPIEIDVNERASPAFQAALTRLRVGELEIVSPCSSPAIVRNRRGSRDPETLNLSLQHVGQVWSASAGQTTILERGDFVLYDPTQPLECRFNEPIQQIVLRLPYDEAVRHLGDLRGKVGLCMRGDVGAGILLSSFIRNVWTELSNDTNNEWSNSLCDILWQLIALAYHPQRSQHSELSLREKRRRRMLSFIEANLREPNLGTREIAASLGVSSRYVQLLFVDMHTTPSAYILDQRLELAARELARRGADAQITDVALDLGFNNLSTFCRSFRRKYCMAPRDYRAQRRS